MFKKIKNWIAKGKNWIAKGIAKAFIKKLQSVLDEVDDVRKLLAPVENEIKILIPGKTDDQIIDSLNESIRLVHLLIDKIKV